MLTFARRRCNIPSGASSGLSRPQYGIPYVAYGTTLSQPGQTSSTYATSCPRTRESTPAGAGAVAGFRSAASLWWRGNAATRGGFALTFRFSLSTFASGHRAFVGLRATSAQIGAVEPSTLVDVIGMRFDTGATAWSLVHADAVSAQTAIALGNVVAADVLELRLTASPGASSVAYRVRNLTAGTTVGSGTLSTNLPSATTFLSWHVHVDTSTDTTVAAQPDFIDVFDDPPVPALA